MRALNIDTTQAQTANTMRAKGCDQCRHIGYKGRLGIFEMFVINDDVRFMINDKASTLQLRKKRANSA